MLKNIETYRKKLDLLVVVDNSDKPNNFVLDKLVKLNNIKIISMHGNQGIAFALNQILNWAKSQRYSWVLTMDQDSICSVNMIDEYLKYINDQKIALICPFVLNNGKITFDEYNKMKLPKVNNIIDPVKCITSGCLTNVKIVDKLGGFNDKLFINCVDVDLNCRVIENGYKIIRVNTAYMIQQMGKGKKIKLFEYIQHLTGMNLFRRSKVIAVYSNKRLYYYSRNSR